MQQEIHDPSPDVIKAAASGVAKAILYICLAAVGIIWVNHRQLDAATIAECENACGTSRGIKEVTSTSCECAAADRISIAESPFVLPR